MSKIKKAAEIIEAMTFLGISTLRFRELRQKHTLDGLHKIMGEKLSGK